MQPDVLPAAALSGRLIPPIQGRDYGHSHANAKPLTTP
jgi:hypothetical protein